MYGKPIIKPKLTEYQRPAKKTVEGKYLGEEGVGHLHRTMSKREERLHSTINMFRGFNEALSKELRAVNKGVQHANDTLDRLEVHGTTYRTATTERRSRPASAVSGRKSRPKSAGVTRQVYQGTTTAAQTEKRQRPRCVCHVCFRVRVEVWQCLGPRLPPCSGAGT